VLYQRPVRVWLYVPLKLLMTSLPFLNLTPEERLPFWLLAILLAFAELLQGNRLVKA